MDARGAHRAAAEDRAAGRGGRIARFLLGAFGDPGHTFPVIALGRELVRRGHEVTIETWNRWEEAAVAEGMAFAPSPEYHVFPTRERPAFAAPSSSDERKSGRCSGETSVGIQPSAISPASAVFFGPIAAR
jgi:hypothetical protein